MGVALCYCPAYACGVKQARSTPNTEQMTARVEKERDRQLMDFGKSGGGGGTIENCAIILL